MTRQEPTTDVAMPDIASIDTLYQQLNLVTTSQRAHFHHFGQPVTPLPMEVVVSTTSQPFTS